MEGRPSARFATITFSDSRTSADDEGGALLGALLSKAGHAVVRHSIVREDAPAVATAIDEALADPGLEGVICTGGTGIALRDVAIEIIEARFDKPLPGFGEAFRRLSWEQIGPRAILSRATAGVGKGKLVVALPGSLKAVMLGVNEVLLPVLPHAIDLLAGRTGHGGHGGGAGKPGRTQGENET
jgi:molybdopterin adenylyltransferase